jgi:hypothetical protein
MSPSNQEHSNANSSASMEDACMPMYSSARLSSSATGKFEIPELQPAIAFLSPPYLSWNSDNFTDLGYGSISDGDFGREETVHMYNKSHRFNLFGPPRPHGSLRCLQNFGGDGNYDYNRSGDSTDITELTDLTDLIEIEGEDSDGAGIQISKIAVAAGIDVSGGPKVELTATEPPDNFVDGPWRANTKYGVHVAALDNLSRFDFQHIRTGDTTEIVSTFKNKTNCNARDGSTEKLTGIGARSARKECTHAVTIMDSTGGGRKSRRYPANSTTGSAKRLSTYAGLDKRKDIEVDSRIVIESLYKDYDRSFPALSKHVGDVLQTKDSNAAATAPTAPTTAEIVAIENPIFNDRPRSQLPAEVQRLDALSRLLTRQTMYKAASYGPKISLPDVTSLTQKSLRRAIYRQINGEGRNKGMNEEQRTQMNDLLNPFPSAAQNSAYNGNGGESVHDEPKFGDWMTNLAHMKAKACLGDQSRHKRVRQTVLSAKAVEFVPSSEIDLAAPDVIPAVLDSAILTPNAPVAIQLALPEPNPAVHRRLPFPVKPPQPVGQILNVQLKDLVLAPRSSVGTHSNTRTWTSVSTAGQEIWSRLVKQLFHMHCDESSVLPRSYAAYLGHKKEVILANIAEKEVLVAKRKAEKALAAKLGYPDGFPTVAAVCMRGKSFHDGRSAVLGQTSMWTRADWRTDEMREQESQWPSVAELKWEGDERAKSRKGRYLPIPRRASWDDKLIHGVPVSGQNRGDKMWQGFGTVPWTQRRKAKLEAIDRVWGEAVLDEEWVFDRAEEIPADMEAALVGGKFLGMLNGWLGGDY